MVKLGSQIWANCRGYFRKREFEVDRDNSPHLSPVSEQVKSPQLSFQVNRINFSWNQWYPRPHGIPWSSFSRGGVNYRGYPGNAISWKAPPAGMLPDSFLVGSHINAVNFVFRHIALHPLNLRAQFCQNPAGFLRNGLELLGGELSRPRNFPFNQELRHTFLLWLRFVSCRSSNLPAFLPSIFHFSFSVSRVLAFTAVTR